MLDETDKPLHMCEIHWRGELIGIFQSYIAGDVDLPDRLSKDAAYAAAERMGAVAVVNEGSGNVA